MGQEIPPSALVHAAITGEGASKRLQLSLFDLEKNCQLQMANAPWSETK
jgi:hypothetical protein